MGICSGNSRLLRGASWPSHVEANSQIFTAYKNRPTVKFLLACTTGGSVSFISKPAAWNMSDFNIPTKLFYSLIKMWTARLVLWSFSKNHSIFNYKKSCMHKILKLLKMSIRACIIFHKKSEHTLWFGSNMLYFKRK